MAAGKNARVCGVSCARLCIYGLLLAAHTLLMIMLGITVGKSGVGSYLSGFTGGVKGSAGVVAPAVVTFDAAVPFKSPILAAKKDEEVAKAEQAAGIVDAAGDKRFQPAPAHLSQAGAGHPGAGWVPFGYVYAKDKTSKDRSHPKMVFPVPTDEELENTALITMATGDESARHAVALIQSLRDTNTRIPNVHVMVFRGGAGSVDCNNPFLRKARGRDHIQCDGTETVANEIVSQKYLDAYTRLGATYAVEDPLPETPFTKDIPGGRQIAWGMALNKLKVFGKDQYKKVRKEANRELRKRGVLRVLKS